MMNMCAVAGFASAASFGICAAPFEIFASADASQRGFRHISAPRLSAAYSLVRLIAICTRAAAIGAIIIVAITPIIPRGLLRLLPKNIAKLASIEIAPAIVAVMVIIRVSRF